MTVETRPSISAMRADHPQAVRVVYDAVRKREPDFPPLDQLLAWARGGAFPAPRPAARGTILSLQYRAHGEPVAVELADNGWPDGLCVRLSVDGSSIYVEVPTEDWYGDDTTWIGHALVDTVLAHHAEIPAREAPRVRLATSGSWLPLWVGNLPIDQVTEAYPGGPTAPPGTTVSVIGRRVGQFIYWPWGGGSTVEYALGRMGLRWFFGWRLRSCDAVFAPRHARQLSTPDWGVEWAWTRQGARASARRILSGLPLGESDRHKAEAAFEIQLASPA